MTLLQGPYDDISSVDKHRITCMIPNDAFNRWFGDGGSFPHRGVQDKVLGRVFHLVDTFLRVNDLCQHFDLENEEVLNEVLNALEIDDKVIEKLKAKTNGQSGESNV